MPKPLGGEDAGSGYVGVLFTGTGGEGESDLQRARRIVLANLDDGSVCPCCDQLARRYKRKLHASMAGTLGWLVRESGVQRRWVDVPAEGPRWLIGSRECSRLNLWGLVELQANLDMPDQHHSGIWRPTDKGVQFVLGMFEAPRVVYTYNGEAHGFSDETTTFIAALGDRFIFSELLDGVDLDELRERGGLCP